MKAILLAGGRGTRISRMIQDVPKCTLPIVDKPLVRITVEKMLARKIEVVICVGYRYEAVKKALEGLKVTYYYNPFYAVTNSIGTLWFAEKELNGDLLIMNADVYFDDIILDRLIASKYKVVMASDVTRIKTGDYFFATREDGDCLAKYGKELPLEARTGEYVGMAKISGEFAPYFKKRIEKLIEEGQYNLWWENVLYSYVEEGKDIHTMDVKGAFWAEVDFFDDYERIVKHVLETQDKK
jgi:choline kinase